MVQGWRPMTGEDLGQVSAISDAVHGRYTEPRHVYAERQRLYPAGCHIFERDGVMAGYLLSHPWVREAPPPLGGLIAGIPADADSYYLHDLALLPMARGTGAGASGTRLAFDRARHAGLADIFLLAVGGADSFWKTRGFTPVADDRLAARLRASYGPDVLYMHYRLQAE